MREGEVGDAGGVAWRGDSASLPPPCQELQEKKSETAVGLGAPRSRQPLPPRQLPALRPLVTYTWRLGRLRRRGGRKVGRPFLGFNVHSDHLRSY